MAASMQYRHARDTRHLLGSGFRILLPAFVALQGVGLGCGCELSSGGHDVDDPIKCQWMMWRPTSHQKYGFLWAKVVSVRSRESIPSLTCIFETQY